MLSLGLSKTLLPLALALSTAHAFGPYNYPRQLNNVTQAPTATGSAFVSLISSGHTTASSLIGTAVSSSDLANSTATSETIPASTGISETVTTGTISTEASSLATAGTSGQDGSSTIASISSSQSVVSNSSSLISTTADPTDSTSSSTVDASITSSNTNVDSLSGSSSGPASITTSSGGAGSTTDAPSLTSTGAAIVPSIIKATDGSDRSTTVTWSAIETGSTSTTDNSGQPTVIPAPFYTCDNPLCINTGCVLAILCSSGGGAAGFDGFPPPSPPPNPPADTGGDDSPSASASPSDDSPTSSASPSSGSTTASSSSSSSSGTCAPITTVADPGPTSVGDPDDGSRRRVRRTLESRLESRLLVAREAPVINTIGTCKLTNQVNIPLFSSFSQAMNLNKQRNANGGANGKIYDAIEKWYAENLAIDGSPFLGSKLENTFSSRTGPGSIDHVWEKSNVGDFLASLIGSDFDCDDMNSLFSSCGVKLQKIFDQLPSMDPKNIQSGFAAMNRNLNGMKGWMFSRGFSVARFSQIYNSDEKIIQGLERQAIVFDWFNSDSGIQSMHDETNNRIYGAFLALDDYISTNKVQRANGRGDLTQQFGPAFKTWYGQLLDNTGSASWKWASDQVTRLEADKSLPYCLQRAINAFQSNPLYSEDKFKIDQSHLSWTATSVTLKRSLLFARDDSCTLPTSTSPSVSPSSATPTSTGPSGETSPPPTTLISTTGTPSSVVTPSPIPSASFGCSNPSPEDGDGLCTCSIGTSVVGTYTPSGTGADWGCPSSPPTTTPAASVPTSSPSPSPSPSSASCFVPDGCENAAAPDGCAVLCA